MPMVLLETALTMKIMAVTVCNYISCILTVTEKLSNSNLVDRD